MDVQQQDMLRKKCDVCMHGSVTVGTKGQIVIPKEVRETLGILPGDSLFVITKLGKAIGMIKSNDLAAFMEYMKKEIDA